MPDTPAKFIDLKQISHGVMFEGSNGYLIADFNNRLLFPQGNNADLTYYKPRTKETLIPKMNGFQEEWINACKGDLKTSCDFKYSGDLIEMMLLGLVAYRVGKKISYDGETGTVTNCPEANAFVDPPYRKGWSL